MTDIESLFLSVGCPVCRAAAGEPCVFRVAIRGYGGGTAHVGRQSKAIASERRDQAADSETLTGPHITHITHNAEDRTHP